MFKKILIILLIFSFSLFVFSLSKNSGKWLEDFKDFVSSQEKPVNPDEDPPVNPDEDPPVDPGEDPPVDPGEDPPVDPGEDPPVNPGEDPPVDPGEDPPVDPDEDPPVDPGEDPPVDPGEDLPNDPDAERSVVNLIWSEDFADTEIYIEDGVQYTDNHISVFGDYCKLSLMDFGDGTKTLYLNHGNEHSGENISLNFVVGFDKSFCEENLSFSNNRFILFKMTIEQINSTSDYCFGYRVLNENAESVFEESKALHFYGQDMVTTRLTAIIDIQENILYFYYSDKVVLIENFLNASDVCMDAFVFSVTRDENLGLYFFDDLELYTFTTEYEGSVEDALNDVKK